MSRGSDDLYPLRVENGMTMATGLTSMRRLRFLSLPSSDGDAEQVSSGLELTFEEFVLLHHPRTTDQPLLSLRREEPAQKRSLLWRLPDILINYIFEYLPVGLAINIGFANGQPTSLGSLPAPVLDGSGLVAGLAAPAEAGWGTVSGHFQASGSLIKTLLPGTGPPPPVFAFEVRFRPVAGGGRRMNLMESQALPGALFLTRGTNGYVLSGAVATPGAWIGVHLDNHPVALGQWHIATLVYDGQQVIVSLNGNRGIKAIRQITSFGTREVWIGTWPDGRGFQFVGDMVGVRVWTALPQRLRDELHHRRFIHLPSSDREAEQGSRGCELTFEEFMSLQYSRMVDQALPKELVQKGGLLLGQTHYIFEYMPAGLAINIKFANGRPTSLGAPPALAIVESSLIAGRAAPSEAGWGTVSGHFQASRSMIKALLPGTGPPPPVFAFEVRFRPMAGGGCRMNLMESQVLPGALFLVRGTNGYVLNGTVATPGAWIGVQLDNHPVALNQWHTATLVYNGQQVIVSLNGNRGIKAIPQVTSFGARAVWIGTWPDGRGYQFVGEMVGVRVWTALPLKLR
jgi:hypothetical protein